MASLIKGLGSLLRKRREERVMLFGNDGSGKTTLLYQLKLGQAITTIPTIGFNVETIEHEKREFMFWDVGGKLEVPCYSIPSYTHLEQDAIRCGLSGSII
jgi:GTPase SAR1 family protein